jgi:prepilin-type N-terminal cleavage/methylation domain-containing protein
MAERRGFTLIELLVVISVIALLVGIVLPSLSGARESSRRTKCLVNLQSIGHGFSMYLKDNKEIFPLVSPLHGGPPGSNDISLLDLLSDYLDAPVPRRESSDPNSPFIVTDPYKCPSDQPGVDRNGDTQAVWQSTGSSYEYYPGPFLVAGELLHLRDPAFGITKAYENRHSFPLVVDYDNYHKIRRTGSGKNAAYFPDYHADWFNDPSSADLQKMFEDLQRFGGIR